MEKSKVSRLGMPYLHLGNGEHLVLIHGLGEVKEGWQAQFELADQYELIIPDLRGHGECTKTEGISVPNFAADVIALLNELKIENAHILGLSMGGAVAQEIYRQAPHLVRSLMLISTFHFFPKTLRKPLLKFKKVRLGIAATDESLKETAAHMSLYSWSEENMNHFKRYFQPKRDIFLKSLKACFQVNNISMLPTITVPTLIIGCQYDSVLPVWIQYCMHKLIPHSEFIIMRNSGHLAKLEATSRFNLLLRKFLNRHKAAA
ncbi:alpha/beta hydrolase [Neobacillus sp. 179-C4.2 HS]|uniref:Alpha/beta hydrolase n=1 Tax=Neobacillus driksii TaxID=3035913 RepID=A0ABV4YWK9_9BACI|nr:alpha/beta hydrolase [Neobacillus sp. 179.-C4.2 HS]MDP5192269.1 alpha/beta hydrolase [Neobacillus sp. 179.-C4.2 HS]